MKKYNAFAIDKNGNRNEIDAESIVIEIAKDKSIEINLQPHPNHFGGLLMVTPANTERLAKKKCNVHSIFNIRPGASNVVHLGIENIENT
ncbi:MAG: hypothetical protein KAH18_12090 [Psychromonas sp.]|nr:hypothetical protein [Psychromonas sp.]